MEEQKPTCEQTKEIMKSENGPKVFYLQRRKREKFIRRVTCHVCGDVANDHNHYGAKACYSCRAFFRRCRAKVQFVCANPDKNCAININTRKVCPYCRYQKCLAVGMRPDFVMTEEDKKERREKTKTGNETKSMTKYEERMRLVKLCM